MRCCGTVALVWSLTLAVTHPTQAMQQPSSSPYRLRVEYMDAPLGIDVPAPRFSWVPPCTAAAPPTTAAGARAASVDDCRGQRQVSYRVVVSTASSTQHHTDTHAISSSSSNGSPVVWWDSGVVNTTKSQNVKFNGTAPLPSNTLFSWSVAVTVAGGAEPPATTSATSTFSTGLLTLADWGGAAWIGAPSTWPPPPPPQPRNGAARRDGGASWTGARAEDGARGSCWTTLAGSYRASMLWGGIDEINITKTGETSNSASYTAVSYRLGPSHLIDFQALSTDHTSSMPGGVGTLGPFNSSAPDCSAIHFASGDSWCRESFCGKCAGWPKCTQPPSPPPPPPAPASSQSTLLRTTFSVSKPVQRAVAYVVGLGYYKLFVDGTRASTHELGTFTNFATRVLYDTIDVTNLLQPGQQQHAIAAMVLRGWYTEKSVHAGVPSLYLRLAITHTDGTFTSVVTSTGWKAAPGPVTDPSDIYSGETCVCSSLLIALFPV
jgi:alpha-L-rhamnosidase